MFIKSIKFPEWHPFYNNWKRIEFGDKQKDLIDFYLKTTKKIKEWDKEILFANNIQINCILWDNGVGKSSLLKEIHDFLWNWWCEWKILVFSNWERFESKYEDIVINIDRNEVGRSTHLQLTPNSLLDNKVYIIIDDYSPGTRLLQYSINRNSLESQMKWYWANQTVVNIYNLLKRKKTSKAIFHSFLNIDEDYDYYLRIKALKRDWIYIWTDSIWIKWSQFNEEELFNAIYNLIQEYNKRETSYFRDISEEFMNFLFLSIIDLLFLYIEECRLNTITNESYDYRNEEDTNPKIRKWIQDFVDSLDALRSLLSELKSISHKDKLFWVPKNFYTEDLIAYNNNLNTWIDILNNYLDWKEDVANSKFMELKILKQRGENIRQFLFNYTWYGYLNVWKLESKSFLKEFIFQDSQPEENIKHIFEMIRTHFVKKLDSLTEDDIGWWIYKYTWWQLDPKFPFKFLQEYFQLDIVFSEDGWWQKNLKKYNDLSWWEKAIITRFSNLYTELHDKYMLSVRNFIILIDEPDLHLHLDWQRQYIQRLIDVFSTIQYPDISLQFIIATHSPFIVSDLPGENIIRMKKDNNGPITFQNYWEWEKDKKTSFWANYIDIIQEWFFDNRLLMWSFAEEVIKNLAISEKIKLSKDLLGDWYKLNKDIKKIEDYLLEWEWKLKKMKEQIGDEFIKNHLLYMNTTWEQ